MANTLTDPLLLGGIAAGAAGLLLLTQARVQTGLLRRRIATGAGTVAVDPATGLFSAAAAWQCIRAEANRAMRLDRPFDVWVGTAPDAAALDVQGRELAFDMPPGCTGVRIDRNRLCVVTCADQSPEDASADLQWVTRRIDPSDDAADQALAFLSDVRGG